MIKVIVTKDGVETHAPEYETMEQAQAAISYHVSEQNWGKPGEYSYEIVTVPVNLQAPINEAALAYLAATDWYVIRASETGVPVPQDILDERAAARLRIVR